jgi:hypothetical protein
MIPTTQSSFPCGEPNCHTTVLMKGRYAVTLQTGCMSSASAYWCPGCGRLYWGGTEDNRGEPVVNRQYKGAYYIDGQVTHRPLCADENRAVVHELIQSYEEMELLGYLTGKLSNLVNLGHAPDCIAVVKEGESCSCGIDSANQFILDHRGEAEGESDD